MLRGRDRELLGLAVPALGALVAEPIVLLAGSAIVGHLGTAELAGLGIASAVLLNVVFLCIFLAHGTTAAVGRQAGAGDMRRAHTLGIDGIWLAIATGVGLGAPGFALAPMLVDVVGASALAMPHALSYVRISLLGLPAMLVVLAATGALRGLKDHPYAAARDRACSCRERAAQPRPPLPVGLGVAGSTLGTVLAQAGAGAWLCAVVVPGGRRHAASRQPDRPGIVPAASANAPLPVPCCCASRC